MIENEANDEKKMKIMKENNNYKNNIRDAKTEKSEQEKNIKKFETTQTELNYFNEYNKRTQSFIMTACIVYSFFLLLFIIWTLINLWSRWNQLIEPVSSNGFDLHNFQQLIYPSITICNIVPDVNLIHNKCKNFEEEIKCPYKEDKIIYKLTKLRKKQVISCLTYNNNIEDAFVTSKLGLQDMLIISVKINIKDYPSNSFTSGVHISLHTQGSNIESGSGLIASSGQVTLIRLKKTINEYLNNTTIESFDGKISTIGDYNFEENWGNKNDTVVLALTYQDLNVMIVKELPPYGILTFLSETGGVLGLLLGTSLVNLIVFLIQWAWGLKFNDYNWVNVQNKKEEDEDYTREKESILKSDNKIKEHNTIKNNNLNEQEYKKFIFPVDYKKPRNSDIIRNEYFKDYDSEKKMDEAVNLKINEEIEIPNDDDKELREGVIKNKNNINTDNNQNHCNNKENNFKINQPRKSNTSQDRNIYNKISII